MLMSRADEFPLRIQECVTQCVQKKDAPDEPETCDVTDINIYSTCATEITSNIMWKLCKCSEVLLYFREGICTLWIRIQFYV